MATEFAIVKVRPTRLQALVDEGRPGAANALKMVEKLDAYLSATQFGITLASLGLGWLGEPAFAHLLEPVLDARGARQAAAPSAGAHRRGGHRASPSSPSCTSCVGELAPKSLAIQRAEAHDAGGGAADARSSTSSSTRASGCSTAWRGWVLQALRAAAARSESHEAHSEEELRVILHSSAQAGAITTARAELLERALEMAQKTARQVMVPRSQVKFLDLEEPLEKNIADARAGGPHLAAGVPRGTWTQVEGVVNVKDLFFLLVQGRAAAAWRRCSGRCSSSRRTCTLEQLLTEFRRRRRQMALVVDEHGGTSRHRHARGRGGRGGGRRGRAGPAGGRGARAARRAARAARAPRSWTTSRTGWTSSSTIEDEDGEVTTIAGYLMAKLGRVPEKGDTLSWTCGASRWRRWTGRAWCA